MKNVKSIISPIVSPLFGKLLILIGWISPKAQASIHYRKSFREKLNWNNPININEKINWLKFYSDTTHWPLLADKYKVREYVKACGLSDMLVKLYGKWDRAEDIEWNSLPNKFIMKTSNGSGDVLICNSKKELDKEKSTAMMKRLLKRRFGYSMAEPHYNKIKPCIIAEELLDNTQQPIKTSSLIDYKIWAFDGKPTYIWVCYNRTRHSVEVGVYDTEWNFHPEFSISTPHYILGKQIPRPKSLEYMLKAAALLSKGLPEVRVDLYEVGGKPYFGEMTLTSAGGFNDFYTTEFLRILGNFTNIKNVIM